MAGGLFALLDDVALIARSAASSVDDVAALAGKTSVKAAGVVVDDTAVTPQYVEGIKPQRELPMIWRITKGSLINKLVIILPIAMILSWIAPWALTPILMCGGTYLCFEGAEKILHHLLPHREKETESVQEKGADAEDSLVKSAITTDLILSSEIMVISLNEVIDQPFWMRLGALIFVGIILTLGVYGAVGLLVKMDDIGMALNERHNGKSTVGNALVKGMPIVLDIIGVIGTAAMLWVGGHIVVKGLHEFGMNQPHEFIVSVTEKISNGALAWLAETGMSMVCGLVLGTVIATIVMAVKASFGKSSSTSSTPAEA
ncbi:DUF808 domain-containing protein [Corynebacterium kefirresidentii]|jgi:hypothetical protein|uniref:DUF808 domain-containing protein n=1 Tax=Corynebacterium TaxID=1716 RepID=UPI0003B8A160|nr:MULTISPECIES: DUF808 domain-containing protein [Corynebacterium]ERS46655.1 hypothetical protein HMPREF1286_02180 [Corynebacterium sp. KPL1860]ERS48025.1 hypothetical protein HMPREF1282_01247 [Corynebacterium sp. KPL1856]ERS53547.1 hypothetical protein HMPREF1264_02109 [Corynebacterium sp. KPL1821]ERS59347.1 hypothetical protein HMPREF1260_01808 [Corynebacterium sp. KPL1817]ERS77447.1 hypothetical protein HMPREF1283_02180 [Corynebacterium sp. KPL1857]